MKDALPVLAFARVLRGQMPVEAVVAIEGRVVAELADKWTREKRLIAEFAQDVATDGSHRPERTITFRGAA